MQQGSKASLLAIVILSLYAPAVGAQAFGRVEITVVTKDGSPVPDVEVVVTQDDMAKFRQEKKTNKRGVVVVSFVDATKTYLFTLNHEDFAQFQEYVKPDLGDTKKVELVLDQGVSVPTGERGERQKFTAAEQAFNDGVIAVQESDLAVAEQKFTEALALDEKLVEAHSALARIFQETEQWQKAVVSADAYIAAKGGDAAAYRVLYESHTRLGNPDEAKAALEQITTDSKDDAAVMLYNEGVAAFRVGDEEEALTRFKEALNLIPDLAPALKASAVIYQRQGEHALAAEASEEYLALEPGDSPTLQIRWRSYRALGDDTRLAAAQADLSTADAQSLSEELARRGTELFQTGDTSSATGEFRVALALNPDHPRAHYQLGLCLLSEGDSAGAKQHLQRFVELSPDDPEAPSAKEMLSYLE